MQNSVTIELTVFGGAAAAGVLLAFLYDLFRLKRRVVKTKAVMVHIEDILYWLSAAIILFLSSYIVSSGETRAYFYAGAIIGGLVYMGVLSGTILWILSLLIKIIVWPFYEIFKFLEPVFRMILLRFRKVTGKIKSRAACENYRIRVNFLRLKNTFTKK